MPTTPQSRSRSPVRLRVREFRRKSGDLDAVPFLPWPLAAVLAAVGAAAAGWVVVTGILLVSWFTAPAMAISSVLGFGTRLWLLSFGAPASIGGDQVTLMPLGLTVLSLCLAVWAGRIATRQAVLARPYADTIVRRLSLAGRVTGLFLVAYVAVVALAGWVVGSAPSLPYACVGAGIVALAGAGWPASKGVGLWPGGGRSTSARKHTHAWGLARRVAAGTGGGLLAALAVSAIVLGVGVVAGWSRIGTIEASLSPDGPGLFSLVVLTLAWLPNALAWALSWTLGGGFAVGLGSTVSLSGTQLGMLPAIPLLGALPTPGVAPVGMVAWLALGVLVGAVAGVVSIVPDPGSGLAERTLLAAACGLLVSGVIVAFAALSRGDLGTLRLVELGPRLGELLTTGPAIIVLSAALAAAVSWLVGRSDEADSLPEAEAG